MVMDQNISKTNEQLVALIQAHENEAENMLALWQQNKGFVYKMAMKYQGYAEIEDLTQEGYIGLCNAVQHYNADQYNSFIHYAAFWIKQVMIRYIDNCCSVVRIPVNARNEILQYKKIYGEYRKYYGKEPTEREMRALLGVSLEKLEAIKKNGLAVTIRSLDEPLGDEEELFLGDTVASDQDMEEDVIKKLDTAAMQESLWKAVDNLDYDMAAVLRKRYQDKMTLKEVGKSLGVSIERARQVERNAIRKLRIPSKCAPFKCYFEQYLAAGPIRHISASRFNHTWTSSTELQALENCEGFYWRNIE
jgi:RNA polymerase primary sigma factor